MARLSAGAITEFVHLRSQPFAQFAEPPVRISSSNCVARIGFDELRRIKTADRVGREISEHADGPVHVLQNAFRAEVGLMPSSALPGSFTPAVDPRLRLIGHQSHLEFRPKMMQMMRHFVGVDPVGAGAATVERAKTFRTDAVSARRTIREAGERNWLNARCADVIFPLRACASCAHAGPSPKTLFRSRRA